MRQLKRVTASILLLTLASSFQLWSGTTGKIAGVVTDKATGERLPGANIVVVGTTLGAAADLSGEYTILYVPPETYSVRISCVGYGRVIVSDVRVYIDQTARVNVALEVQTAELGETIILAERKAIKPDVSTSVVAFSDKEMEKMPVNNVIDVMNLQAGVGTGGGAGGAGWNFNGYTRGKVSVQGGLSIRGGEGDNILFMVDGVTLRDPRNNEPATRVAMSGVQEISIERGGFNAEYGQVRSGIVNVVTKEGSKQGYNGSFQIRFSPPAAKYWQGPGIRDVNDPYSFALRPFYDPAVAWTGTANGAWDEYTRKQYPEFAGWNEISRILNTDNDPTNDLTPAGAQRVFEYETRKEQINNQPDYNIDAGVGGPFPFVSDMLGNLRFFTTYRSTREMLLFPLTRPDYQDWDATVQLNSDITPSMRLRFSGLWGMQHTIRHNWDATGIYFYPRTPSDIAGVASGISASTDLVGLFSDFNFCLADIGQRSLAAKLTNTLSAKTYYDVSIEQFSRDYNVGPTAPRDLTKLYQIIPGFYEDSNPFGYQPMNSYGVLVTGGGHVSKARDFTTVSSTTVKANFTSQVNFQNMVKAGIEFDYNDLNFDYGTIASLTQGQSYGTRVQMRAFPLRGSGYLQDKLEANGFILNGGLRLDYSNSNSTWWSLDPYTFSFFSSKFKSTTSFDKLKSEPQWQLSPRLGIAHPITENSKLFFNYGHFKQVPQYESIFRLQRNQDNSMSSFGAPNLVLAKTISYELGYDQLLPEDLLFQVAAFYNDISNQQDFTQYTSKIGGYAYTLATSNNYEDVRGVEVTLRKTATRWYSGQINYTYQVGTAGHFGSSQYFDDPGLQKEWDDATIHFYQNQPSPTPFARANLNFYTPEDFGPAVFGQNLLGDFVVNVLLNWSAGGMVTWNPNNLPTVAFNVQSVDYYNANLRIDKSINIGKFKFLVFVDISNLLNTKRLWNTGDQEYMRSLHLPENEAYPNIPGSDKVGDYRNPDVDFQPMEHVDRIDLTQAGKARAWYFEDKSGQYFKYENNAWSQVDQKDINRVLDQKAYIDMPNASTYWFLDPRQTFFGIRVSFNFSEL